MFGFPGVKLCTDKGPMGCIVRKFATSKELGEADEEEDEEIWGVPFSSGLDSDDGSVREVDQARRKVSEKEPSVKKVQRRIGLGDVWRHQVRALSDRTARELLRGAAASSDVVLQQVKEKIIQDGTTPPAKKSKRVDGTIQKCSNEIATVQVVIHNSPSPVVLKTFISTSSRKRKFSNRDTEASAIDALHTESVHGLLLNASKIVPAVHKLAKAKFDEINKSDGQLRDPGAFIKDTAMISKQLESAKVFCKQIEAVSRGAVAGTSKPALSTLLDCSADVLVLTAIIDRTRKQVTAACSDGTKQKSLLVLCDICDLINKVCSAHGSRQYAREVREQLRIDGTLAEAMFHVLEVMTMKEFTAIRKHKDIVMRIWRHTLGHDEFRFAEVFSKLEDTD
ncbi:hypothetical protein LTR17_012526 [Elasticomyces elasticus]|nr:hypothetical protein LTR17_012526 [Elasticomyces elasticus]